jgi:hypothetical protein
MRAAIGPLNSNQYIDCSSTHFTAMQLTAVICTLLVSAASARVFTLHDDINYWGDSHTETQPDDDNCCTHPKV